MRAWKNMGRGLGAVVLVAGFLLCGCTQETGKNELIILCGNSFGPPMEALCEKFTEQTGVAVSTTLAGSEDLLPLVKAAQKGDIFITHDPFLDEVEKLGFLADHAHVGHVAPVLAVRKGNPKKLQSIDDLTREGLRVALSDPQYSTCGEMVFALLEKKKIKDAVLKNVENRLTKGHSQLGTFLKTDAVDAVIMWNGVANTFKDSIDIVKTPYEYAEEIRVHVMGLNYSRHTEWVQKFVALAKEEGVKIFSDHGYVK